MRSTTTRFGFLIIAVAALGAASAARAISCEELRSSVEAKIQSKGVKHFSVSIVEIHTTASGQVVGTCELGSKKLIYSKLGSQTSASVQATPPLQPSSSPRASVVTECADGRVITQGSCKR